MSKTFEFLGLTIHWYGVILTFGMICALGLFYILAKRNHIESDFVLSMFIFAIVFAILGARLFFVIPRAEYWQWDSFSDFLNMFNIAEGGLTIIGGIPCGALGIYICCRIYKKSLFRVLDLVVPALLLGQVIGRWGNFVNGELYGMEITNESLQFFPFGVQIGGTWHCANFFYEMVLNAIALIVFLILIYKFQNKLKCGFISVSYVIWYGIVRGILEFVKIDQLTWNGIRVIQLICFICAGLGIIVLVLLQLNIIKLETDKMRQLHYIHVSHEPPEYESSPTNEQEVNEITILNDKNNDDITKDNAGDNNE